MVVEQSHSRISDFMKKGLTKRPDASHDSNGLQEKGILQEMTLLKEKLFIHPKMMLLLTSESKQLI
jgi:hypothetical protein